MKKWRSGLRNGAWLAAASRNRRFQAVSRNRRFQKSTVSRNQRFQAVSPLAHVATYSASLTFGPPASLCAHAPDPH
eukprot:4193798-Prymnesium_polylepis.1